MITSVSGSTNQTGMSLGRMRQLVALVVLSLTFFIKHVKDPINALNLKNDSKVNNANDYLNMR